MKRFFLLAASLICFYHITTAQPLRSVPIDLMIETADENMENGHYYSALEWYEKAYKEEKNKDIAQKVAFIHYKLRDYKRAESWYGRLLRRDRDNVYAEERLMYAVVLKAQGKYKEATEAFRQYASETSDVNRRAFALKELQGMEMANELPENIEVVVTLADRNINSGFSDFSPRRYNDGVLYFASFDRDDEIDLDENDGNQYAQIYTASKGEKGYEKPALLGSHINREEFHTGNVTFSRDGKRMYFTRSLLEGNELAESRIYVSYRNDRGWSPAVELQGVNGSYVAKHPCVGELFGNEVLFFSANMDGGNGGFDIYYATRRGDADFASPVNLGSVINTLGDEVTPFYKDGTLYFSSNGHPSLGGLDIYQTSWDGTSWSELQNMGHGYNTAADDWYLSFDADGMNGFLVSNRPDRKKRNLKSRTCCDDIYEINIREVVIDLLALVEDEDGPLNGANVELFDLTTEDDGTFKSNTGGNQFKFLLDSDHSYKAVVTRDDYFPDTIEFNTVGILDDYTVRRKVVLRKKPTEPEVEIITINQPIRLNNIYYDFDDWEILPDAEKDLSALYDLMIQYPDMVIELSSHTDARGVSTYNQKLSQRRAESAKNWLVDKGIVDERIKPVGYGESQILNRCTNGVRCSDDEHRFNRRTEFKIIEGPQSIEIKKEVIRGPQHKNQ